MQAPKAPTEHDRNERGQVLRQPTTRIVRLGAFWCAMGRNRQDA